MYGPGKVLLDGALAVALGGDCPADAAMLRAEPEVFGPGASDPAISRFIGGRGDRGGPRLRRRHPHPGPRPEADHTRKAKRHTGRSDGPNACRVASPHLPTPGIAAGPHALAVLPQAGPRLRQHGGWPTTPSRPHRDTPA